MTSLRLDEVLALIQSLPHKSAVYGSHKWLYDPNHYPTYFSVFQTLQPKTIFEVGTFLGYSLAAAALALPGRLEAVYGLDDESGLVNSNRLAEENIRSVCDKSLKITISKYSTDLISLLDDHYDGVDVVHIDGDHSYAAVRNDLQSAKRIVSNKGYIIGHDLRLAGSGVRKAVEDFTSRYVEVTNLTNGMFIIPMSESIDELIKRLEANAVECIKHEV